MSAETPEQLVNDAFKVAALSITRLYKTATAAQAKSRSDAYQEALEDLMAFLDKEGLGMTESDGEGAKIRKWIADRLEGRDTVSQGGMESEDETDKAVEHNQPARSSASPEIRRSGSAAQLSCVRNEVTMRDSAPQTLSSPSPPTASTNHQPTHVAATVPASPLVEELPEISVPTQDVFTFQTPLPYPQESYMSLANLDLSDSRALEGSARSTASAPTSRTSRGRNGQRNGNAGGRGTLGRGAGQKRKVNLAEIFDLGSLGHGNGRDMFGSGGGKRSKHA